MPVNENSLVNLRPPWTSETAPKGRTNAGLSVNEERNRLADKCREFVQEIVDNPESTVAQIAAAKQWLRALNDETPDASLAAICDYTSGKPNQKSDVTHHDGEPRTESERAEKRDRVLARIRGRIGRPA